MPMGLEARCGRILDEVVTVSQRIRRSVLAYANHQNLSVSDRLRGKLEMIRVSADTILEACTRASLTNDILDDRMIDWLLSGELPLCLSKLKEMDAMLKPVGQTRLVMGAARPLRQGEDKLSATMVLIDKHKYLFHFLLTPDIWDRQNPLHKIPQLITGPIMEDTHHNPQETLSNNTTTTGCDTETEAEYETASEYDHNENSPLSARVRAMTRIDRKKFLHTQQKLDEVSRWLAPLDCKEKHANTLKLRQEGTCKWFPSTDAFKKWRAYGSQFLWLHGKAGCGKSVLIASTIEHLKKTVQDEEVVVFFYCDFRNERSTNSTELMRSVLSQLIRHIRDCGVDPGDLANKILEQKSEGSLSLNDLDKLGDLVSRAASRFRYEPVIVIDALDECADMEALLRAVVTLKEADVRLLLTSRPHQIIMDHFQELRSLSIENVVKELAMDISLHVKRELDSRDRLRCTSEDMKNEVHAKLTERAVGRFRWVQCQLDILDRCVSRPELREALDNLPNELEATYEIILGAIDERKSEGELARRALAWLVVALEPLHLAQVVDGLYIILPLKVDREWLRVALLHALSSLVSYNEETDALALSHFSVREYLTSSTALPMYQIIPHAAHAEVAQMCMRFISVFLKAKPSQRNVTPLQSFPMLSYVFSSGFIHLAHVDPESATTLDALQSLGSDVRHHPSHWECFCELREELLRWPYPPWPSSRHDFVHYILIAYSSLGLIELFLSLGYPRKPRVKTNPLVYAADLRKTEHAMALLAYGADVNMPGLAVDDSHYALPLDIAIDHGEDVLVGELLQRGCVVTSEVLTTAVCMPWCSSRVLVKLMQTDEFVEWAHDMGDEKLYRGVFNSARPNGGDSKRTDEDHVAIARILRQIGQDLSADSQFGAELVERAIHAAHTSTLEFLLAPDHPPPSRFLIAASTGDTPETVSVVRFLLRKGVDIHAISNGRRDTALHLAVMCPWEPRRLELIQLLMEAGCNPTTRNLEGKTVFALAIKLGYSSALVLLLSYDVSIPSDILPFALQKRSNLGTVEFLIRKGADLHSTTSNGNTIFHLAITQYPQSECLDLVKSFIEAGCNPNTSNTEGKTVFEVAIRHKYTKLAELLLSHNVPPPSDILPIALQKRSNLQTVEFLIRKGADLHSTTSDGNTIFHLTIALYPQSKCLDMVKSFIEAGCNPNTPNSEGSTVFEVAIERKYTELAELLLSHNVPLPSDILPIALQKRSDLQIVEFLIRKGADLHSTTSDGNTIFHLAITKYQESDCWCLVKIFMNAGCNPNTYNSRGKSVSEVAIERKYFVLSEFVLSYTTPLASDILVSALQKRWWPWMVGFLIQRGADLHCTTSTGDTIHHLAITEYCESDCWDLVKSFVKAGCNPVTSNSRGKTVLEITIEREYTSVVRLLLSYDSPFPFDILPFAINAGYSELASLNLAKILVDAGYEVMAQDSNSRNAVLEAAMKRGYTSVVQFLLLCDIHPPSFDILSKALQQRRSPQMIRFLARRCPNDFVVESESHCQDTLLQLVHASYTGQDRHRIVRILSAARKTKRTISNS